ncbi:MAG: hypothetical protein IPH88_16750 [Bacteroidales bacterium]|nr:hypothetical protein [Bacteroidales bacterium]
MQKITLLLICIFFLSLIANAQVGINTDCSLPHNSAMLDVKSTEKGVLLPRMTYNELVAISSPAEGLMAFAPIVGPVPLEPWLSIRVVFGTL